MFFCFQGYSQSITDSIYSKFRRAVIEFLENENKNNKDTLIVVFNCNAIRFEKDNDYEGSIYTIKKDTCRANDFYLNEAKFNNVVITNSDTYDFFLNFLLSDKNVEQPGFGDVIGSYAYVYLPIEEWQQFFLDFLIGHKNLSISPTIDFFIFKNGRVKHYRQKIVFFFTTQNDFKKREIKTMKRMEVHVNR